jgi:hypothetical protein
MPTITRQLVNGPSREELFDALRLQPSRIVVNFDVAMPALPEQPVGQPSSEEQLLAAVLPYVPSFPSIVTGIKRLDETGFRWQVEAVFSKTDYAPNHTVKLVADLNTRDRRNSGLLMVTYEVKASSA